MRPDGIEHWPGMLRQITEELNFISVEVGQEKQRLLAQDDEARVVHRADRVRCPGERGHQRR